VWDWSWGIDVLNEEQLLQFVCCQTFFDHAWTRNTTTHEKSAQQKKSKLDFVIGSAAAVIENTNVFLLMHVCLSFFSPLSGRHDEVMGNTDHAMP